MKRGGGRRRTDRMAAGLALLLVLLLLTFALSGCSSRKRGAPEADSPGASEPASAADEQASASDDAGSMISENDPEHGNGTEAEGSAAGELASTSDDAGTLFSGHGDATEADGSAASDPASTSDDTGTLFSGHGDGTEADGPAASESASASASRRGALPEEVRGLVPAEYDQINEIVTASLTGDMSNVASLTARFTFETKYPPDETVYLLFGVFRNGWTQWLVREGRTNADGSVSVKLEREQLELLHGEPFALTVVSKGTP